MAAMVFLRASISIFWFNPNPVAGTLTENETFATNVFLRIAVDFMMFSRKFSQIYSRRFSQNQIEICAYLRNFIYKHLTSLPPWDQ